MSPLLKTARPPVFSNVEDVDSIFSDDITAARPTSEAAVFSCAVDVAIGFILTADSPITPSPCGNVDSNADIDDISDSDTDSDTDSDRGFLFLDTNTLCSNSDNLDGNVEVDNNDDSDGDVVADDSDGNGGAAG